MTEGPAAVLGGIEAGGTKFVCAVGTGPDDIRARTVVPTTHRTETLDRVIGFFARQRATLAIDALGIASFGPLDLTPTSPGYGRITTTPKAGWAGTDLLGFFRARLGVPVALDTDVNGAAYGEHRWGAGRGLHSIAYLTVGTGIGGGVVIGGRPLRGLLHPEMGHLHVQRHPQDDFDGCCPFHGDCIEGLASGPAIERRTGRRPSDLDTLRDGVVALEAWYLAQLVTAVTYLLTPQRVILGGGVMNLPGLLDAVRARTVERLGGAIDAAVLGDGLRRYVVEPALTNSSGVLGALALAELTLTADPKPCAPSGPIGPPYRSARRTARPVPPSA
jgi:fructokinase